jgi:hypothetical protein
MIAFILPPVEKVERELKKIGERTDYTHKKIHNNTQGHTLSHFAGRMG